MNTPELARIADIVPPAPPAATGSATVIYLVIAIMMVAAIYSIYRFRQSATSQLRRLRRQHQQGMTDKRQLAFELSLLICQQLQLHRISPDHPPANSPKQEWHQFAALLQYACFSRHSSDNDSLDRVLNEARFWLHRQP